MPPSSSTPQSPGARTSHVLGAPRLPRTSPGLSHPAQVSPLRCNADISSGHVYPPRSGCSGAGREQVRSGLGAAGWCWGAEPAEFAWALCRLQRLHGSGPGQEAAQSCSSTAPHGSPRAVAHSHPPLVLLSSASAGILPSQSWHVPALAATRPSGAFWYLWGRAWLLPPLSEAQGLSLLWEKLK